MAASEIALSVLVSTTTVLSKTPEPGSFPSPASATCGHRFARRARQRENLDVGEAGVSAPAGESAARVAEGDVMNPTLFGPRFNSGDAYPNWVCVNTSAMLFSPTTLSTIEVHVNIRGQHTEGDAGT